MFKVNNYRRVPKPKMTIDMTDPRIIQHEAAHAFYQWEAATYGTDSPLSDYDRDTWMQGYMYAYKQLKGLIK